MSEKNLTVSEPSVKPTLKEEFAAHWFAAIFVTTFGFIGGVTSTFIAGMCFLDHTWLPRVIAEATRGIF